MKLWAISIAATAIGLGVTRSNSTFVIAGAVIHFACGIADLLLLHRYAKMIAQCATQPKAQASLTVRVANFLQGVITVAGLGLVITTDTAETSGYSTAGWVIWGGALFCFFISGIIVREVGGIPLKLGYGGWRIERDRID